MNNFTSINTKVVKILPCSVWQSIIFKRNFTVTPDKNHFDIVIAGGGMVGNTLACALGKNPRLSHKRILVLEANKEKKWTLSDKFSNRVVSLSPGTIKLLRDLGAWDFIANTRFATVKRLQVWDALSNASITFGEETSADDISYIVENDLLQEAVNKQLKDISNVDILFGAKAKNYCLPESDENKTKIIMEDDNQYTCELLLGCDGANSQVRKAMDVPYTTWKYNQMGVVSTLKFAEDFENNIGWQRFLPTGPIAFLPLSKNSSSLVWSTTPEHAKELLKMSEMEFVDSVNEALWKTFQRNTIIDDVTKAFQNALNFLNCPSDKIRRYPPKVERIEEGSRAAFPLGFGHAASYIAKGAVLVGDAAHRVHPLAGQGVNLGFGDVICLNEVLGKAVYSGGSLNDLSYLKEYESQKQLSNVPAMLAIDSLHRLYNTAFTPVVLLRSLGLQATQSLEPLKRFIKNQAAAV